VAQGATPGAEDRPRMTRGHMPPMPRAGGRLVPVWTVDVSDRASFARPGPVAEGAMGGPPSCAAPSRPPARRFSPPWPATARFERRRPAGNVPEFSLLVHRGGAKVVVRATAVRDFRTTDVVVHVVAAPAPIAKAVIGRIASPT
jgi:hypothetical protein